MCVKTRKLNTIRLFCAELSLLFKLDDLCPIDKGFAMEFSSSDQFTLKSPKILNWLGELRIN